MTQDTPTIEKLVEQLAIVFDDGYSRPTFGQLDFFRTTITKVAEEARRGEREQCMKAVKDIASVTTISTDISITPIIANPTQFTALVEERAEHLSDK